MVKAIIFYIIYFEYHWFDSNTSIGEDQLAVGGDMVVGAGLIYFESQLRLVSLRALDAAV